MGRTDMAANATTIAINPTAASRIEQIFPVLPARLRAEVAAHGRLRPTQPGQILFDVGNASSPFFLVTAGEIELIQPSADTTILLRSLGPGQFTGEVNLLSGRPALVQARVSAAGEVVELDHGQLLSLVQTSSELSEIQMRAFILRRVELLSQGLGNVVVIGSVHCAGTLRVKAFLGRNNHPYAYVDLDEDADVQTVLDRFNVAEEDIPVVICRGELVLRRPTNTQIAECLGFNEAIDQAQLRDVIVVGSGPAGLAAAVYAASEGLDVLILESDLPGGQAASSSKIENFFGFPTGISGHALTSRAYVQAQKFGAKVMVASGASKLDCTKRPYTLETADGQRLRARTIIVASGASYRKPPIAELARFEGTGVYYAATFMEAQLARSEPVVVIGGANSAGQAAVYLSQTASRVYLLVRGGGLGETMSRYLIRRIEENPAIELRTHTELTALAGDSHLERVQWRNKRTGEVEDHDIRHVFVMAGAEPNTSWLQNCVALDAKGFIKTGVELSDQDLTDAGWPLPRRPLLMESSKPGVFAIGDVRSGSIKRVASAVGEGSISVLFVHQVINE
jgi:thioredoxin reductase (NADPH)